MAPGDAALHSDQHALLKQILSTVQSIQNDYQHLSAAVEAIQGQVSVLSRVKQVHDIAGSKCLSESHNAPGEPSSTAHQQVASDNQLGPNSPDSSSKFGYIGSSEARTDGELLYGRKYSALATSRIILTTYPGQSGIDPLTMNWGHADALKRGPVVVSRSQSTVRRRNGKRSEAYIPQHL